MLRAYPHVVLTVGGIHSVDSGGLINSKIIQNTKK